MRALILLLVIAVASYFVWTLLPDDEMRAGIKGFIRRHALPVILIVLAVLVVGYVAYFLDAPFIFF